MAISSPRVVRSTAQSRGVSHTNAPSQFAQLQQQKRQFTSQILTNFAQMDPDQQVLMARQNPDMVESALKETNLNGRQAAAMVEQMAGGTLSPEMQAQLKQGLIMAAGEYQQGSPAPQPTPTPTPTPTPQPGQQDPDISRPQSVIGLERRNVGKRVTGPNAIEISPEGYRQAMELGKRAANDGQQDLSDQYRRRAEQIANQLKPEEAQNLDNLEWLKDIDGGLNEIGGEPTVTQGAEATFRVFDDNVGAGTAYNNTISLMNNREQVLNRETGQIDYDLFNNYLPKVEPGQSPEDIEGYQEAYGALSVDDAIRVRAQAEVMLQRGASREAIFAQAEGGPGGEEPGGIPNPTNWMWDRNLSPEEVREIQATKIDGEWANAEQMFGLYTQKLEGQINDNYQAKEKTYNNRVAQYAQNPESMLPRGRREQLDKTREGLTAEDGRLVIREGMSTEQMNTVTQRYEQALGIMDKGMPKNEQEARQRLQATLDYAQTGLEVYSGAEGEQAFIETRNIRQGNAYLEAQLMIEQNKNEIQRMLAEHGMSMDEAELALKFEAFELEAAAAQAEANADDVDSVQALMGTMRKAANDVLPEDISEMDGRTLAEAYDQNPVFRTAWDNYMKSYAKYMQMNGFTNVEYKTEEMRYGLFSRLGGGTQVDFPTVGVPQEGVGAEAFGQLSPEDQQWIQQINQSLGY